MLYQGLLRFHDSPVVCLNAVVALSMVEGPERGLKTLARLEADKRLDGTHLLWAAKTDLQRRAGRVEEAVVAYRKALEMVKNASEERYLWRRLDAPADPDGRRC